MDSIMAHLDLYLIYFGITSYQASGSDQKSIPIKLGMPQDNCLGTQKI